MATVRELGENHMTMQTDHDACERLSMQNGSSQAGPASAPADRIDLTSPDLFRGEHHAHVFDYLRENDPVHLQMSADGGSFWNVTRYEDIFAVDTNHAVFSSRNSSFINDMPRDFLVSMFLAMDPPRHTIYRDTVKPAFAAAHIATLEGTIREKTRLVLDALPIGEEFDWVSHASVELTSYVLAAMFDFPAEHRHKLIRWSDLTVEKPDQPDGSMMSWDKRKDGFMECLREFNELKEQRRGNRGIDLVTLLAGAHGSKPLKPSEFIGNVLMLLFAGNDTTRNSMSGSVVAFDRFPRELHRLQGDSSLLGSAVQEIFRWQSPVAYMRRVAVVDTELGGKRIKAGDKVAIWFASGNRDDRVFERPHDFDITRKNVNKHMAFGHGVHRCIGLRLAEMQLRILWEEILVRFSSVEVVAEPRHVPSSFIKGYAQLPVILHRKTGGA